MDTYLAKVQIGNNVNDLTPIASTLYGVCNSQATATTKVVTLNKFDRLIHGVTLQVRFTYGNSIASNVKLQVGNTLAYDISGNCVCSENEVISFTFDEVDANHKYWRAHVSGISEGLENYINSLINTSTETPDIFIMKGTIGAGGNPGYLPNSDYEVGWVYRVVTAGTYIGEECGVGDLVIAVSNARLNQVAINPAHWLIIHQTPAASVSGPNSSVDQHVVIFSGTTGKILEDSGFTIEKSVPANAIFTDTKYSAGTGLSLDGTTFNVQFGNSAGTAVQGNDPRLSDDRTPLHHPHGNITWDGKLDDEANVLLKTNNAGLIIGGPALGNSTTTFLNNTGVFSSIPIDAIPVNDIESALTFPVTSVNGQTGDVTINATTIGINPMHFIGQATVPILVNNDPHIQNYDFTNSKAIGDVILDMSNGREYVWTIDGEWEMLGPAASTTIDSNDINTSVPSLNENVNVWVSRVTQSSTGAISVERSALDTTGTWLGDAGTLSTPREIVVDLAEPRGANVNTRVFFDGSQDVEIQVKGVLGVPQGGTGEASFNTNEVLMTNATSGTGSFVTKAYTDNTVATAIQNTNTFVTERSIYYGLPKFNDGHDYTYNTVYYAPTSSGNENAILVSGTRTVGANTITDPLWAEAATLDSSVSDDTSTAYTILTLGNSYGAAIGNSQGQLVLYSASIGAHILSGTDTTSNVTHYLQGSTGYLLQGPTAGAIGTNTNPIYINANGEAIALTYTANRLYYSASSSSFTATNHYADANHIAIGTDTWPTVDDTAITDALYVNGNSKLNGNIYVDGTSTLSGNVAINGAPETGVSAHNFYVNGTSNLNGATDITGITHISNLTAAAASGLANTPEGALIVEGGAHIKKNIYVDLTSNLLSYVSIGEEINPNNSTYILTIHGSTNIKGDHTDAAFIQIDSDLNNIDTINFIPATSGHGKIGTTLNQWQSASFSDLLVVGSSNGLVTIDEEGSISIVNDTSEISLTTVDSNNTVGVISIAAAAPTIILDSITTDAATWNILNNSGVFTLTNDGLTPITLTGNDYGMMLSGRLYINPLNTLTVQDTLDLYVNGTTQLNDCVGINTAPDDSTNNTYYILTINGSTKIIDGSSEAAYIALTTELVNNTSVSTVNFYPTTNGTGNIGTSNNKWANGYFASTVSVSGNTANNSIVLDATGTLTIESTLTSPSAHNIITLDTSSTGNGLITINAEQPSILLDTNTTSASDWIIMNDSGEFSINNQLTNIAEFKGTNYGFEIQSRLYINPLNGIGADTSLDLYVHNKTELLGRVGIGTTPDSATSGDIHILTIKGSTLISADGSNNSEVTAAHIDVIQDSTYKSVSFYPEQNNTGTLGLDSSSGPNRWKSVYIGTSDTYGDEYTPIYWNDGVPTEVAVTQVYDFTIASNTSSTTISLTNTYRDRAVVTELVVTDGFSNVTAPLLWNVNTNNHQIVISLDGGVASGTITGYVTVSTGPAASNS